MEGIDPVMLDSMDVATSLGVMAFMGVYMFVMLAIVVVTMVIQWKVYVKAGQPGWAAIIPIYNIYVLLQIIGRPTWWLLLLFVPFVNLIALVIIQIDVAKSFGKDVLFGIGLLVLQPIFYGILAFGDAQYQGPAAAR